MSVKYSNVRYHTVLPHGSLNTKAKISHRRIEDRQTTGIRLNTAIKCMYYKIEVISKSIHFATVAHRMTMIHEASRVESHFFELVDIVS